MDLIIYKGFDTSFLLDLSEMPLVTGSIESKTNVCQFDKNIKKQLDLALLSMNENARTWITYEEYSLIQSRVKEAVTEYGLKAIIYRNNTFPECYPVPFELSDSLIEEVQKALDSNSMEKCSEFCQRFLSVYSSLVVVDGTCYGSFYNYEYDCDDIILSTDYYQDIQEIEDSVAETDYTVFLNEDIEAYLRDLSSILHTNPRLIGLKSTNGLISKRMQLSLQALCASRGIRISYDHSSLLQNDVPEQDLIRIAREEIGIRCFSGFRMIRFYKNPDLSNEVIEVSQGQIIREIIHQAENAYDDASGNTFRDVFITASTGAGKSVMFQIPAVYLAQKHQKITIIIEPVKALMQDQKETLNRNGYTRVEAFNSDLISQVEKEAVIKRIKDGEVDLLYLSPETLLSYSIETIIGDREIGLLIIDEAHIVTTWGVGFRPDYWYLGGYLNRLRSQIQTKKGQKSRVYHFPICAFTATAINGGPDDSVSDTIVSLYMENPIKYIGYVRRDDIRFEIVHREPSGKMPQSEYYQKKANALDARIRDWLSHNSKTIVYFPYASLAADAARGVREFAGIIVDRRIGTYTGRNVNEMSSEAFSEEKHRVFEQFRKGIMPIMLATKAFGMGVDVDDVENVYHYAVTGNLCDYVQEIGRAARKQGMKGTAITDSFYGDINFMKALFGMSRIRQDQIKEVLKGIYFTYRNKKEARSFLISPQSFTYIFGGEKSEDACINKLKTCLLMIEKDLYDKYNFKVMVSRPQSVFTKAFVCVDRDREQFVLSSKYKDCFKFVHKGRFHEPEPDGYSTTTDVGDIYLIDLKRIWEQSYPNISFPQFKFWYFNAGSTATDKVEIMPEIREYIHPRHKVNIESKRDLLLSELRPAILEDFEFIADQLYSHYRNQFFTTEDVANLLREKYGKGKARIIANSLFELVDPDGRCVKRRHNDTTGQFSYLLSNGNFKEYLRRPIIKSSIVDKISCRVNDTSFSGYLRISAKDNSTIALKLLSIFDYITYEILGGEEPEIFIRLNDPNKVRQIAMGEMYYSNSYVSRAKQKHDRDVEILLHFFDKLRTDVERWDYIESYFLGKDVLLENEPLPVSNVKMSAIVDKEHSYATSRFDRWDEIVSFFDENERILINKLISYGIKIPEYLQTVIKRSDAGNDILMSWPSKNLLICQQDTSEPVMGYYRSNGWTAYRIHELDLEKIQEELA